MRFRRIVVVTRKTQLQELRERFVTDAQARFYIERMGQSFQEYEEAHASYMSALDTLLEALPDRPRHTILDRSFLPTFTFFEGDLVVPLGNNGLVVNAAKYLAGQPILGVNADPTREEGVIVPFTVADLDDALAAVLRGRYRTEEVTMARAMLNDGQEILAFNDLFVGRLDHISARYRIEHDGATENQLSSGIIVSTGAGSTGWLKSVFAGALGIAREMSTGVLLSEDEWDPRFEWASDRLKFAVREPWPSTTTQAGIVFGWVDDANPLRIASRMPEGGVIFSDGVLEDAVSFNSGSVAKIGLADTRAILVAGVHPGGGLVGAS